VKKEATASGCADNNLYESGDSQTVHGWCRGYPIGNNRGSHLAFQRGYWCGGSMLW